MALTGKLIGHVEISSVVDVLHDLLRYKPHDMSPICPDTIHACDLVSGQQGEVGSIICWTYIHDGEKHASKELIEEIDEANHKIVFKLIEGDLLEIYKAFKMTFQIEPKDDTQLVTLTFDFKKTDSTIPDPTSVMEQFCGNVKDMDDHFNTK